MKTIVASAVLLLVGLAWAPARADLIPAAVISSNFNGIDYNYSITLTNSGASSVNLGTFWFAWVPGKDFLDTRPVSGGFVTPQGWTANVTGGGASDGFAIQWVAGTNAAITPVNSLVFGFESVDTPAQVAGFSNFFPTTRVTTAVVYQNGPFSGLSDTFIVPFAVPEPSSMALLAIGAVGTFMGWRRRRRAGADCG